MPWTKLAIEELDLSGGDARAVQQTCCGRLYIRSGETISPARPIPPITEKPGWDAGVRRGR